MADQNDVRRIALSLPETEEAKGRFAFSVRSKGKPKAFIWAWNERVEPKKPRVPRADVVAVRVANLGEKNLLLSMDGAKFFTEPHYDGYPAVLVRLPEVTFDELELLITDAWRCQAPRTLVKDRRAPSPAPAPPAPRAARAITRARAARKRRSAG